MNEMYMVAIIMFLISILQKLYNNDTESFITTFLSVIITIIAIFK